MGNLPNTAYAIVIKGNEASEFYYNYCKPTWESAGITVERFRATTPATLKLKTGLTFAKYSANAKYLNLKIKAKITDTEKAAWFSHFELWQHCCYINEPIIILEHDSYLEHPQNLWMDEKYGIIFFDKAAMGSYVIQPWFARELVDAARSTIINSGPYGFIYALGVEKKISKKIVNDLHGMYKPASNQVMSQQYGNTIVHYCNLNPDHWEPDDFHAFKYI